MHATDPRVHTSPFDHFVLKHLEQLLANFVFLRRSEPTHGEVKLMSIAAWVKLYPHGIHLAGR
jgi:hypothetical protein